MADVKVIPNNPLVEKLLAGESPPNDLIELIGYVGPSESAGTIRLYRDFSLKSWYEVPVADVQFESAVDPSDPNSPTRLFVGPDTALGHVQIDQVSGAASFVQGKIADASLAGSEAVVLFRDGQYYLRSNPPRACKP